MRSSHLVMGAPLTSRTTTAAATSSLVVDLVGVKALAPIDTTLRAPHGLAFVGGKLWFTAEGAKAIGSYDPASAKIDWVLQTGQNRTHMIFVSDDLARIVTSNVSSATMTMIQEECRPGPDAGRAGRCSAGNGQPRPGAGWAGWAGRLGGNRGPRRPGRGRVRCLAGREGNLGGERTGWHRLDRRRCDENRHADTGRQRQRSEPSEVHARWETRIRLDAQRSRRGDYRCWESGAR